MVLKNIIIINPSNSTLFLTLFFYWGFNYYFYNGDAQKFTSIFYSGVGVNIYFHNQQKFSYFMGPEVHFGVGSESIASWGSNGKRVYINEEFPYFRILINNGLAYTFKSNLRLSAVFVFGIQNYNLYNSPNDGVTPIFYFTGSIGYRF